MADLRNDQVPAAPGSWHSRRELHGEEPLSQRQSHEFMAGVTDAFDIKTLPAMSRKRFLALLAASAAFATTGCTGYRDKGAIVPYSKNPEEITPGLPTYYASTCTGCSQACGILVKTREGRPIKVDGNPDHPVNAGKTCSKGQAAILNLYDPNRLRKPGFGARTTRIGDVAWSDVDSLVVGHLQECTKASREVAVITHPTISPTASRLLREFALRWPTARIYAYDVFHDEPRRRAWELCYGTRSHPVVAWENASVIVALESDFLGTEGHTVEQVRKFAARRNVMASTDFNRLYVVEGGMSLTGANADYRLRLRPDAQLEFVLALLHEILVVRRTAPIPAALSGTLGSVTLGGAATRFGLPPTLLAHLVDDLMKHRGSAMVHAGRTLPEPVHVAVNYLNEVLGNTTLYAVQESSGAVDPLSTASEIDTLVNRMRTGVVGMIIHLDCNPVYHFPPAFQYAEALRSVPVSVGLVEADNETSERCTFVLPVHHALESWGDATVRTGVYSLQQPVIAPLYDTRQKEAVLLAWMNPDRPFSETVYHTYLQEHWKTTIMPRAGASGDAASFWFSALHDGVLTLPEPAPPRKGFAETALEIVRPQSGGSGALVGLTESMFIGDGRFANNGWLQELPDPVSKVVWDNYAALSPATAQELGVSTNDRLEVTLPHGTQTLPVFVQPGQADGYVTVALGYGRSAAGVIGSGVGVNTHVLLPREALAGSRLIRGARLSKGSGSHPLVSTQEHHALDDPLLKDIHRRRKIIREGTLRQYMQDPGFLHHQKLELFSIAKEVTYDGVKWAMAIDLNKCVGCNACVSGCNVENNIPVVGKEQVEKGREMQWIRIDRYFSGTPENPMLSHQPMLCQHCDTAPCENVCPVVATTHSPDGLNQMVYNRCVGTKYCSNNCPYKVRRFNFFNFRDHLADGYYASESVGLVHNPEVTVRSRGVMEKCTFCVQRIMEARQHATEQGRALRGEDVRTACQEACPAQAIVFGDMNDPMSEIARYRSHQLGYSVLEEFNVRPNVTYIARLRNIHAEGLT